MQALKFTVLDEVQSGFETSVIEDTSRGVNLGLDDSKNALAEMIKSGVGIAQTTNITSAN